MRKEIREIRNFRYKEKERLEISDMGKQIREIRDFRYKEKERLEISDMRKEIREIRDFGCKEKERLDISDMRKEIREIRDFRYKETIMHGHDRHNTTVLSIIHNTSTARFGQYYFRPWIQLSEKTTQYII